MKSFTKVGEAAKSSRAPSIPQIPNLQSVFALINSQLYAVEERIREQAGEFDPAVAGYIAYACESNGKRLRPALALLSAGATGEIRSTHLELAVVLELIHAATLVHDDIMDGAEKRRGEPTANARWGNAITVLLGDCLFAHALKISTNFADGEVSRRLAAAASEVCSGEIIQTQRRFDLKLSIADYLKIIDMKTAALFSVATELGAFLNEAKPETISSFKRFGKKLGIAYQIYDDCLDLAGDEAAAGKTLGTDLQKGKLTLPILHLLQAASSSEHEQLSSVILSGEVEDLASLRDLAVDGGAMQISIDTARRLLREARDCLQVAAPGKYRAGLEELTLALDQMLNRFAA